MNDTPRPTQKPVACFGEMLLRLSSRPGVPLSGAGQLDIAVGGAEANVAMALASLGWPTRMLSVLPENPLGRRALAALGAAGVDRTFVRLAGDRMGLYFFEPPSGPVPGSVTYDRAGSAFASARVEEIDFAAAVEAASLLHVSGITPALGPRGVELASAAIAAARQAGVPISFDGNYRASLWDGWDGDPRTILIDLIGSAEILFGNHRDISLLLGREFSGDGPDRRREAAEAAFSAFPQLQVIASTARHVRSAIEHRLAGRVDLRESHWQTDEIRIAPVIDRIGTGDAFAAGVLLRWLEGGSAEEMSVAGLALAAMKHGVAGDAILTTREALSSFSPDVADVSR
jgi:2-dehydro-3-deoxygluconokinase